MINITMVIPLFPSHCSVWHLYGWARPLTRLRTSASNAALSPWEHFYLELIRVRDTLARIFVDCPRERPSKWRVDALLGPVDAASQRVSVIGVCIAMAVGLARNHGYSRSLVQYPDCFILTFSPLPTCLEQAVWVT
jgi:hypothetical protein